MSALKLWKVRLQKHLELIQIANVQNTYTQIQYEYHLFYSIVGTIFWHIFTGIVGKTRMGPNAHGSILTIELRLFPMGPILFRATPTASTMQRFSNWQNRWISTSISSRSQCLSPMKKFYDQIAQLVDGAYEMTACLIFTKQYSILNYVKTWADCPLDQN